MALTAPEPPPAEKQEAEIRTFSFVPRLGLQGGGSVAYAFKCEGSSCADIDSTNNSIDLDLGSAFMFGADFMFKLGDLFRIGPGIMHTLTTKAEYQGVSNDVGSVTELNFVAEVIPRVSPIVWLVPRVQTGLAMFSATGPLKTSLSDAKSTCTTDRTSASSYGVNVDCSNFDNPHLGFDIGLGFGAMFAVSPTVRLRADAMYEYFDFSLGNEEASGGGVDFKQSLKLSGSRYIFMAGVEI